MCERAKLGYVSDEYEDWCYWNAAFYIKDNTICELINRVEFITLDRWQNQS